MYDKRADKQKCLSAFCIEAVDFLLFISVQRHSAGEISCYKFKVENSGNRHF
ncbi:hypothetical protein MITSMUL_04415 [Mitsuokella multacida DSM 20544]|uniref:Uncharacterized protein n=1 Tax=Mitsuokella multacida DSM 20544 TaxID=500635 RepID=C9KMH9_9FIRM|nr:hypothetical protein MITSMUL_04415 [Mitsuokella multacida DSM 20544]